MAFPWQRSHAGHDTAVTSSTVPNRIIPFCCIGGTTNASRSSTQRSPMRFSRLSLPTGRSGLVIDGLPVTGQLSPLRAERPPARSHPAYA